MENIWTIKPCVVGILPVPEWECVFGRNDCTLRDITFWVWILRCGDQIGLIDTGLPVGPDLDRLNHANQQLDAGCVFSQPKSLAEILAGENITPEDVDFALITQLVTYSTGGLSAKNLPRAKIYCAWEGMEELFTRIPGHPPREFYFTGEGWNYLRDLLMEDRIVFAQNQVEVAPGVIFESTGGHHPGSAAVRVSVSGGTVGIVETAFVQENIESEVPIGIAENAALCREVIRRYRRECDLTIAGHEPAAALLLADFLRG